MNIMKFKPSLENYLSAEKMFLNKIKEMLIFLCDNYGHIDSRVANVKVLESNSEVYTEEGENSVAVTHISPNNVYSVYTYRHGGVHEREFSTVPNEKLYEITMDLWQKHCGFPECPFEVVCSSKELSYHPLTDGDFYTVKNVVYGETATFFNLVDDNGETSLFDSNLFLRP